jgi:hypothetical protein
MYAKSDLYAGQELFFDYGYNSKSTKFVPLEHNSRPKDSKVRVKLAGRGGTKVSKGNGTKQRTALQRVTKVEDEEVEESGEEGESDASFEDSEGSY